MLTDIRNISIDIDCVLTVAVFHEKTPSFDKQYM